MLMADETERDWLREAHPEEYNQYLRDPQTQHEMEDYRLHEEKLRAQAPLAGPDPDDMQGVASAHGKVGGPPKVRGVDVDKGPPFTGVEFRVV